MHVRDIGLPTVSFEQGVDFHSLHRPRPHQLASTEIEGRRQRVGRLLVILDTELASECDGCLRPFGIAHAPARDTHFVYPLVADVAVACVPEPVPVVLEAELVEGAHRGRSQEKIPVHARRRRFVGGVADGNAALEAQAFGHVDLADGTVPQCLHALDLEGGAAVLGADLDNLLRVRGHLDHHLAFVDVVAGGLFAVHILAGLARPDGGQRVPVVGGCDGNGVDRGVGERLPHVLVLGGLLVAILHQSSVGDFARGLVDVTNARDAGAGDPGIGVEVVGATTAYAYNGDVDLVVRTPDSGCCGRRGGS